MYTITKYLVPILLCLTLSSLGAQEKAQDSVKNSYNESRIEVLKKLKKTIEEEEREFLKDEVRAINERQDRGDITAAEADKLRKEAAKKRALNIENRLAIIDNKIALLERNESGYEVNSDSNGQFSISIGNDGDVDWTAIRLGRKNKPRKYDRRTTSDLVFAIGFNNAIIEGQNLDDSPYKIGGSGFVELGWAWKTRIFENTNFWRLKYGFSFQWNKLNIKDNQYFVRDGDMVQLQDFPVNLDKAKFRTTNLVFPVHLEIGPSRKIERDTYFRYSTRRQFKLGLGGYAGFNIGTLQKLKYDEDGRDVKDKMKGGLNTSDFIYGLSGYLAWGGTARYVKYDLNPIFQNQAIEQNNISVGLRFDMD
ncbi:MAG: hypothetical protein AAF901_05460 [Bacteroidota bacterium]